MNPIYIEALGWVAGTVISISTIPNLIRNLNGDPDEATFERNCLQLAGNGLWAAYGLLLGAWPILVLCGINASLTGLLVVQQLRVKLVRRAKLSPNPPSAPSENGVDLPSL